MRRFQLILGSLCLMAGVTGICVADPIPDGWICDKAGGTKCAPGACCNEILVVPQPQPGGGFTPGLYTYNYVHNAVAYPGCVHVTFASVCEDDTAVFNCPAKMYGYSFYPEDPAPLICNPGQVGTYYLRDDSCPFLKCKNPQ